MYHHGQLFKETALCVCMLGCRYVYTPCVYSASGDQKGVLEPLELELQIVVSFHVVVGK